jgi:hypothetical protein
MSDNYILYDPAEFDKIEVKEAIPSPLITRLEVIAKRYALDEVKEAAARIAALEAALKPFADEASMYDTPEDDYAQLAFRTYFLVAHLRAARAAYLGEKE